MESNGSVPEHDSITQFDATGVSTVQLSWTAEYSKLKKLAEQSKSYQLKDFDLSFTEVCALSQSMYNLPYLYVMNKVH